MYRPLMLVVWLVLQAGVAAAQRGLPVSADSNDANTWYQYGVTLLRVKPRDAAVAFDRAHHLTPDWADPLYARSVAMLMDNEPLLRSYIRGGRNRDKKLQAVDSLYLQALSLNPFFFRRFDRQLLDKYFDVLIRSSGNQNAADDNFMRFQIDRYLKDDPELRGWMAYADGRFDDAMKHYTTALKTESRNVDLLAARGRAAFLRADYATALTDITTALDLLRQADAKERQAFYDSKAVLEQSIATVHLLKGDTAAARDAYARALQEDLSYYPAHMQLAMVMLMANDTSGAMNEYNLAVQIRSNDPILRYRLGILSLATGHAADAVEHLKAAIAAEPLFAPSYRMLGMSYEMMNDKPAALAQYQAFLAHAPQGHPAREWTQQQIEALQRE